MTTRQNENLRFEPLGQTYPENLTYEPLAADPTGADLWAGRTWYNTTENRHKTYDGTKIRDEWSDDSPWKASVQAASDVDVALAAAPATIDGYTPANGDRILIANQTNPIENGIYIYNGAGNAMTRAEDLDDGTEAEAANVFVQQGATYANMIYGQIEDGVTIGTDPQTWTLTGGGAAVANASETVAGISQLATNAAALAGTDTVTNLTPANLAFVLDERCHSQLIGPVAANTAFSFAHTIPGLLANERLIVQVEDVATGNTVHVNWDNDATNITVTPVAAIGANAYRVTALKAC